MISLHEGRGGRPRRPADRVLALHLEVAGARPRVWRRLLVRESMWLSRLHEALQIAFEWYDYQTHCFQLDDLRYGNPVAGEEHPVEDDRDVAVSDLDLEHRGPCVYHYHFGEGWRVEIRLETVRALEKGAAYPRCTAGERAGPPEDCGGLDAFHDMLDCLKEPQTDLGREWREWVGPDYQPDACDLARINKALKRLGR